ncbi:radical SAM protein [Ventosimonas gracilis]|uniref:Radical SAM protein n=1 Tax=Ventosimonas gracilis TaxID=1680762 RepID=A0A139SQR9_9GAMM|nr:5-amino-6-(D-ribitylamino)uracil--L-tyrosine 4-hydroxyphenyl transferase CofH [Ventosimonas gracilis]KXU36949.1 radical SAM protein [Ventosimonas gracilis]
MQRLIDLIHGQSLEKCLDAAQSPVRSALEEALQGGELSQSQGEALLGCSDSDLPALLAVANQVRRERVGEAVSFVVTRNINFTNVCYMGCRFCGFARHRHAPDAYWLDLDEIVGRAEIAAQRGATELCLQGGLHPNLPDTWYRDLLAAIKKRLPTIHLHAFSPFEIWYGAQKRRLSTEDFLTELKEAGLGSIPGTAAEILDTQIRQQLTRNKLSAEDWVNTVKTAHRLGIRSTATMMYGHVDAPRHWAAHIALLRGIQRQTSGFTEFVPLGFIHSQAPLYVQRAIPHVRAGASLGEHLRVHAAARLLLAGFIDNIQVSWVKLGAARAAQMLDFGVNDLGGTLMEESISRAAGADFGEELTALEMVQLIRSKARLPVRRGTLYQHLESYQDHDPEDLGALKPRRQQCIPLQSLELECA